MFDRREILETIRMIQVEHLDIRTITLGISIKDCSFEDIDATCDAIYNKIIEKAENLVEEAKNLEEKYSIPIMNKRISLTPVADILAPSIKGREKSEAVEYATKVALAMERAAAKLKIDFIGGYSALVQKGFDYSDEVLIDSIPKALNSTERVCSSVNVASTRSGINMDAVLKMAHVIKDASKLRPVNGAKLVTFANAPSDNPFMAGAFHGHEEGETCINVGISGPGVIRAVLENSQNASFGELAEIIKRTAFKITRVGELIGREIAKRLNVNFGIIDLSLAPTPFPGDSVANIIEAMGIEKCGAHGTTAALAMLVDAVKKGGVMATSYVGGLSGAFIPVSEDSGMVDAVKAKAMSIEKLEALTSVCSVGLDMIVIPEDTPVETIAGIIADECAIGVINDKTTGVRLIVAGKEGEYIDFGGLMGGAYVMPVNKFSCGKFVRRGGRIPAPIHSVKN